MESVNFTNLFRTLELSLEVGERLNISTGISDLNAFIGKFKDSSKEDLIKAVELDYS
jgi:hypothetical protein